MALIITMTKARVDYVQPNLWNLVLHAEIRDGATLVIDQDYFVIYRPGNTIIDKRDELIAMVQKDIDQYINGQVIFNNADLAKLIGNVKSGLKLEN